MTGNICRSERHIRQKTPGSILGFSEAGLSLKSKNNGSTSVWMDAGNAITAGALSTGITRVWPLQNLCHLLSTQHSKQIRGTIAGWNASAKANPSRGLFWKIVVKPSKTRVLTWQDLVQVLLWCRNLAFTWLCGLHTLIKCCQVRWCWQMRLLKVWLSDWELWQMSLEVV